MTDTLPTLEEARQSLAQCQSEQDAAHQRLISLQAQEAELRRALDASMLREDFQRLTGEIATAAADVAFASNQLQQALGATAEAQRVEALASGRQMLQQLDDNAQRRRQLALKLDKLAAQLAPLVAEYREVCTQGVDLVAAAFKLAMPNDPRRLEDSAHALSLTRPNSGAFRNACATMVLGAFGDGGSNGAWGEIAHAIELGAGHPSNPQWCISFSRGVDEELTALSGRLAPVERVLREEGAQR